MTLLQMHLRQLLFVLLGVLLLSLVACSPRTRQPSTTIQAPSSILTPTDVREVVSGNPASAVSNGVITPHTLAQSNLIVSNQVISSTPIVENTLARAQRSANRSNLPIVSSQVLNRPLHYHSTNDRFLSPLELHLKQIDTLANNQLALVYEIANPSNAARIIDPRGARSQGNMLLDAAGNTYPALSTLSPIVVPERTRISYYVVYAAPTRQEQVIVRAGLDDVSENVASTLAPFALSLHEASSYQHTQGIATETIPMDATTTMTEETMTEATTEEVSDTEPVVVVSPSTNVSTVADTSNTSTASVQVPQTPVTQTPVTQTPVTQTPPAPRYPDIQNVMDNLLSSFDEPIALTSALVDSYTMQNILAFDGGASPLMVRLERIERFANGIWRFHYTVYNGTNAIHAVRLDPSQSDIRDNTGQSYRSDTLGASVDLQPEEQRAFYLDYQSNNFTITAFDIQLGLKDLSNNVTIQPFSITLPDSAIVLG